MKLLVDKSLLSYATPAVFSGFSASQHNVGIMPTFDIFDSYEPDIYIADADLLTNTVYKAIEERPALRVFVHDGNNNVEKKKEFEARFGTLYQWGKLNDCADLYTYKKAEYVKEYKADLVSFETGIEGFLEGLIIPESLIFRIFSPSVIHSSRYCGFVPEPMVKNIYKSSKFSIATDKTSYNSIICDCYPIDPKKFTLDTLYENKDSEIKSLKETVLANNTNFHVISNLLNTLGFDKEAKIIMEKMKELL